MKSLFLYPLVTFSLVLLLIVYWIMVTAFITSLDDKDVKDKVLNSAQVCWGREDFKCSAVYCCVV
jgi:hypothetical protein